MICPDCRSPVSGALAACPRCGRRLQGTANPAHASPSPEIQSGGSQPAAPRATSAEPAPRSQRNQPAASAAEHQPLTPAAIATVRLTTGQRRRLLRGGLGTIASVGLLALFSRDIFSRTPWIILLIGLALAGLYGAFLWFSDAFRGTANVRTARLIRVREGYERSISKRYYADFAGLGEVAVNRAFYQRAVEGGIYRVTYSPATMLAWECVAAGPDA